MEEPFLPQLAPQLGVANADRAQHYVGEGSDSARGRFKSHSTPGMRPLGKGSHSALKQATGLTPNALQRLTGGALDTSRPRRPNMVNAGGSAARGRESVGRIDRCANGAPVHAH